MNKFQAPGTYDQTNSKIRTQNSELRTQNSELIPWSCSPVVLIVFCVFAEFLNLLIAADLVGTFFAKDLRKVDIRLATLFIDHFYSCQVFTDRVIGKVGVAERAEQVDMLAFLQAEGMMDDHIILTQLRVEKDDAALAAFLPGRKDYFGMGHQVPAAVWTKKIVCFHDW